jgi:hypothetical protein
MAILIRVDKEKDTLASFCPPQIVAALGKVTKMLLLRLLLPVVLFFERLSWESIHCHCCNKSNSQRTCFGPSKHRKHPISHQVVIPAQQREELLFYPPPPPHPH